LEEVYNNENTFVLFPSQTAVELENFATMIRDSEHSTAVNELLPNRNKNNSLIFHVIVIDGTWSQASGIYYTNKELQSMKQVRFTSHN
jgi:DTW domain-containing protein YfiP